MATCVWQAVNYIVTFEVAEDGTCCVHASWSAGGQDRENCLGDFPSLAHGVANLYNRCTKKRIRFRAGNIAIDSKNWVSFWTKPPPEYVMAEAMLLASDL